jgi:hypothetical protein
MAENMIYLERCVRADETAENEVTANLNKSRQSRGPMIRRIVSHCRKKTQLVENVDQSLHPNENPSCLL